MPPEGLGLYPFVVDTWGGLAPTARTFLTTLVKRVVKRPAGVDRQSQEMSVWQRLLFPTMAVIARQLSVMVTVPPLQHNPYHD